MSIATNSSETSTMMTFVPNATGKTTLLARRLNAILRTKFNKASTKPGSQSADLIRYSSFKARLILTCFKNSKAATLTNQIQENLQSVRKDQSHPVEEKKSEEPVVVENKQVEASAPKQVSF